MKSKWKIIGLLIVLSLLTQIFSNELKKEKQFNVFTYNEQEILNSADDLIESNSNINQSFQIFFEEESSQQKTFETDFLQKEEQIEKSNKHMRKTTTCISADVNAKVNNYQFPPIYASTTPIEIKFKSVSKTGNIQSYAVNLFLLLNSAYSPSTTETDFTLYCYDTNKELCVHLITTSSTNGQLEIRKTNALSSSIVLINTPISDLFLNKQWFPISLSYYYDPDNIFYPPMLNVQVNGIEYPINTISSDLVGYFDAPNEFQITILNTFKASYSEIWIWKKYIKGSYGRLYKQYQNPLDTIMTKMLGQKNGCTCFVPTDLVLPPGINFPDIDFTCEYDADINPVYSANFCDADPGFNDLNPSGNIWDCKQNAICLYGYHHELIKKYGTAPTKDDCSCESLYNPPDNLLVRDASEKSVCFTNHLVELSPYLPYTVEVSTTSRFRYTDYTLEFWVLIIPYVSNPQLTMKYDIEWEKTIKIELNKLAGEALKSSCYPVYSSRFKEKSTGLALEFKKWFYIRCSVNLETDKNWFFFYTYQDKESKDNQGQLLSTDYIHDTTGGLNLIISSTDTDKGLIFITDIKLWNSFIQTDKSNPLASTKLVNYISTATLPLIDKANVNFAAQPTMQNSWKGYNYIQRSDYSDLNINFDDTYSYLQGPISETTGDYIDFKLKPIPNPNPNIQEFTINFFIRLIRIIDTTKAGTKKKIINYSSKLSLHFSKQYSLQSINDIAISSKDNNHFGVWIPITLSYYYSSVPTVKDVFPIMMNFQIGTKNIVIDRTIDIADLFPSGVEFTISKDAFASFAKIWIWKKYITGGWAFVNKEMKAITPSVNIIKYLESGSRQNCVTAFDTDNVLDDYIFNCPKSYHKLLNKNEYCFPSFTPITGDCKSEPTTCSEGYYDKNTIALNPQLCSCMLHYNPLLVHGAEHYSCIKPTDLEFSRYNPVKLETNLNHVGNQYTIEFWTYVETYMKEEFTPIDIQWGDHAIIKLSKANSTSINVELSPHDSITSPEKIAQILALSLISPNWFYIRFSVDFNTRKTMIFFSNLLTKSVSQLIAIPKNPSSNRFLKFNVDNVNQGIVFFRQIRLWDLYESPNDSIMLPPHALYSHLLHYWEPLEDSKITDKKDGIANPDDTITQNGDWVGYNIIPDEYPLFDPQCISNEYNYFVSATNYLGFADLTFKTSLLNNKAISVNFYIRMIEHSGIKHTVLCYSNSLCIFYNPSNPFDLTLETSSTTLFRSKGFNSKYYKWTQISLGYFYDISINHIFPAMINFQVNMVNLPLVSATLDITNLIFSEITLSKGANSTFGKIWIWNTYLNGAWSFVSNKNNAYTVLAKLIDKKGCPCINKVTEITDTTLNINCHFFYADILNEEKFCTPKKTLLNEEGICEPEKTQCPYGFNEKDIGINYCSCQFKQQDMLLLKPDANGKTKCYYQDLIEFNKASTTKFSTIETNNQYTIEFWFYSQTYVPYVTGKFELYYSISLINFMKVIIEYEGGNYKGVCVPVNLENTSIYCAVPPIPPAPCKEENKYKATESRLNIESKWTHIRCSVDRKAEIYYHYQHSNKIDKTGQKASGPLNTIPPYPNQTELVFSSVNPNEGVVYIQHLRLWKCFFCHFVIKNNFVIGSSISNAYNQLVLNSDLKNDKTGQLTNLVNANLTPIGTDSRFLGYNQLNFDDYEEFTVPVIPPPTAQNFYYLYAPSYGTKAGKDEEIDVVFNYNPVVLANNLKEISVIFFVKLFGWSGNVESGYFDIFSYGNLVVRYSFLSKATHKIELVYKETGKPLKVLSKTPDEKAIMGNWIEVSLSYYYAPNRQNYYPPMLNFQINYEPIEIKLEDPFPASDVVISELKIPKESVGYYGRIFAVNRYITGSWSTFVHYYTTYSHGVGGILLFIDQKTISQCIDEAIDVKLDLTFQNHQFTCAYDTHTLLNTDYCPNKVDPITNHYDTSFYTGINCVSNPNCIYGYYSQTPDVDKARLCSCDITHRDIFVLLYKSKYPYCKIPDYLNFFMVSPVTVDNVATNKIAATIEFWMYFEVYINSGFAGFEIDWKSQMKIEIKYSLNKFNTICYPDYGTQQHYSISFNSKHWVYVHCGVDYVNKRFSHFNSEPAGAEIENNSLVAPSGSPGTLKFTATNVNQGILHFRQVRLWKSYLGPNNSIYNRELKDTVKEYYYLLHVWDPFYSNTLAPIQEYQTKSSTSEMKYAISGDFIGYNILSSSYTKLVLCVENVTTCNELLNFKNILDFIIQDINPARNDRYTIDLWTKHSNVINLTKSYSAVWRNIISVTMIKHDSLNKMKVICWPQDFRIDLAQVDSITKINAQLAYQVNSDVDSCDNDTWCHVRCAMHKNNQEFYLNENKIKPLRGDLTWNDRITIQYTDYGMRYFWKENQKSIFKIVNFSSSNNYVFKSIYLFTDYIPQSYDFGNMDLALLDKGKFSSMVLSINFHYLWNFMNILIFEKNGQRTKINNMPFKTNIFKTTVQSQCNPNIPETYDTSKTTNCKLYSPTPCTTNCDWEFAKADTIPLLCKDNFIWDYTNKCNTVCGNGYIRSPNTKLDTICNFKCSNSVYSKCNGLNDIEITDIETNLVCPTDYFKFNQWCYSESQSVRQYMYFSGCTNFNHISYTFAANSFPYTTYLIDFWIKIDKFNEFCTSSGKKYYLIAEPHFIYGDNVGNLFYELKAQGAEADTISKPLSKISLYHWNYFIIHVFPNERKISIFLNHMMSEAIEGIKASIDLTLKKLVFCSSDSLCENNSFKSIDRWGSVFYKNINFWEGTNVNQLVLNQLTDKPAVNQLTALLFSFTFSLSTSRDNNIRNIKDPSKTDGMNYLAKYNTDPNGSIYNADKEMFINFASQARFDYSVDHFQDFISNQDMETGLVTIKKCYETCATCSNFNDPNNCMSCISGYTLYLSTCKKSTGFFLQMPVTKTIDYISMQFDNYYNGFYLQKKNKFTFTIWMKLFGESSSTGTADPNKCFIIMKFDNLNYALTTSEDDKVYICYKAQDTTLQFYIEGKALYISKFSDRLGQWTLIAISSLINIGKYDSALSDYYDKMLRFFIQEKEIVKEIGPTLNIPLNGLIFKGIEISNKSTAYFYDLRLYSNFIMNPLGYLTGPKSLKHIGLRIPLMSHLENQCLKISDIYYTQTSPDTLDKELGLTCAEDYNIFADVACESNEKFEETSNDYCEMCNLDCFETCSYKATDPPENVNQGCTCDMSSRNQWFRQTEKLEDKVYCEKVPYVEFSKGTYRIENVKISRTKEYSIEFYIYVFNYNSPKIGFEGHEVYWDKHNYLHFYKKDTKLYVHCSPIFNSHDKKSYANIGTADDKEIAYFKWVRIICSTTLGDKLYTFNEDIVDKKLEIDETLLFDNTIDPKPYTQLVFKPDDNARTSYGFIFIREIKLWSSYAASKSDTLCKIESTFYNYFVDYANFLLHYFSNAEGGETMTDLVEVNVRSYFTAATNFIGYNVINRLHDYKFQDLKACAVLEIYPMTGLMDITKFILRAKKPDHFTSSTTFELFFYRKGDSIIKYDITLEDNTQVELIRKFYQNELPLLPNENKITLEFFCIITDNNPANPQTLKLHRELILTKRLNITETPLEDLLYKYEVDPDLTDLEIEDTGEMLNGLFPESEINAIKCNETQEDNCSGNGKCYSIGQTDICNCFEGFDGYLCQLDTKNKVYLFTFASKLLDSIKINVHRQRNNAFSKSFASAMNYIADIWIYSTSQEDPLILKTYLEIFDFFVDNTHLHLINDDNLNFTLSTISKLMIYTEKKIKDEKLEMMLDNAEWYIPQRDPKIKTKTKKASNNNILRMLQTIIVPSEKETVVPRDESYGYNFSDYSSVEYDLDGLLANQYEAIFNKFQIYLETISSSVTDNNANIAFSNSYESFDFYITSLTPSTFKFKEYLNLRRNQNKSYIDADECLRNYADEHSMSNDKIYLMYISFIYPMRTYKADLHNTTISHSHMVRFLDKNIRPFNLTCSDYSVHHYLPIDTPFNPSFAINYYPYPDKYEEDMRLNGDNLSYYRKYIFRNGSIDFVHTNKQLIKYYRNFSPRLKYFQMQDGTLQLSDAQYVNIITDYSYFVSKELNSAIYSVTTYDQPSQYKRESYYFVYYPQLFRGGVNYLLNIIFYVLSTLFILMFGAAMIIIAYSVWRYKKNHTHLIIQEINELFEQNEQFHFIRFPWVVENVPVQLTWSESKELKKKIKENPNNSKLLKYWNYAHKDYFGKPSKINLRYIKESIEECEYLRDSDSDSHILLKGIDHIKADATKVAGAKGLKIMLNDINDRPEDVSISIEKVSRIVLDNDSVDLPGIEKRGTKHPLLLLKEENDKLKKEEEEIIIKRQNFTYITNKKGSQATKRVYVVIKVIEPPQEVIEEEQEIKSVSSGSDYDIDDREFNDQYSVYNPKDFILKYNIYSTFFWYKTPFSSRIKQLLKPYTHFLLLICSVSGLFIFNYDFAKVDHPKYVSVSKMAAFIIIAVYFANFVSIILSLMTYVTLDKKRQMIQKNLFNSQDIRDLIESICLGVLNLFLFGSLFYVCVGFSIIWIEWSGMLLVMWFFTLFTDFFLMEIVFELIIFALNAFRRKYKFIRNILRSAIWLKNVRNL